MIHACVAMYTHIARRIPAMTKGSLSGYFWQ